MKKRNIFLVMLVVVLGMVLAGCATASSIGGASGPHGFFTGNGAVGSLTDGATEIATYSVILGLIDSGYDEYASAVKAAEAEGKKVTSVTKWMFFIVKTTAYAE